MGRFIAFGIFVAGLSGSATLGPEEVRMFDSIGLMPEIVVTAPQYEYQDDAWSGLMPEVIVTAPRINSENMNSQVMLANKEPNSPDVDNAPVQNGVKNRAGSQWFGIDINTAIILGILGIAILIIGLLLPYFLHKFATPSRRMCNCEK